MAEPTPRPSHTHENRRLISRLLAFISQAVAVLIISWVCSIIMEWIGLAFFWPEQGWHHSQAMLSTELSFLDEDFKQSLLIDEPGPTLHQWLALAEQWLWERSGFGAFATGARDASAQDTFWGGINQIYVSIEDYALAAVFVSLTFAVRIWILLLTTPMTMLAVITGAMDGLVRRDLRKFGAGRESSFVYHRVKRMILPCVFLPWMIYLSLPFSLNPVWVLIPSTVLLGLLVAITTSTFKKYI
ncbi:TIGR03747 family integrating conjugative element membrane protein [Pseudomonas sp. LRF_L74]|uniref:TIGR03747 family integrating conjugative element membrane protein n=1 Tax=Pseudomonas sp. LRF_L74 TaxID=3369422 RepID=UPI003F617358